MKNNASFGRSKGRSILIALALLLLISGCGTDSTSPSNPKQRLAPAARPAQQQAIARQPRNETVERLASKLRAEAGFSSNLSAVREALALGGIATWDGKQTITPAAAPAASSLAIPEETVALALEARHRATAGRLTLAQLGEMLRDLGWPFKGGTPPGVQLQWILEGWVKDGLAAPNKPLSFASLFVHKLATAQKPPVNLADSRSYAPEELRLTLLELYLFASHFDRLRVAGSASKASNRSFWLGQTVYAASPCEEAKKWWGDKVVKDAVDWGQLIAGEAVGAGLDQGLGLAGLTEGQLANLGKALAALNIAGMLTKLVAVYGDVQLVVTVESDNPIHKMLESEPRLLSGFKATAGLNDAEWEEYKKNLAPSEAMQAVRDCLATAGLPNLPNLADMGKEAEVWSVQWRLIKGMPHGFMSLDVNDFYLPGQWEMKLKRETDHSASAMLLVDITQEKGKSHTGSEKKGQVVAEAALETAAPPSIGTFISAMKGPLGLGQSLAELGAGWILEMFPPKAYGVLDVTYHEPSGGWSGTISYSYRKASDNTVTDKLGFFPAHNRDAETHSEDLTFQVGFSQLEVATGPEEIHVLNGDANVTYFRETINESRTQKETCRRGNIVDLFYTSRNETRADWGGPLKARLMLTKGGAYEVTIASLPYLPATEVSEWSQIGWSACEQQKTGDKSTSKREVAAASSGKVFSGNIDPRQPDAIKGSYERKLGNDTTAKTTWNLTRK